MTFSAKENSALGAKISEVGPLKNLRTVVADDDYGCRRSMRELLQPFVEQPIEVSDGNKALEMFRAHAPDLMILDASMPQLSGVDVLRHVRNSARSLTPVILTGGRNRTERLEAVAAGATEFFEKPLDPPLFVAKIQQVL